MGKNNLLPSFNNPRRRIKKPSQSKRYLTNSYSDLMRIEQYGPRNREERRALDKYYKRTGQGKYYSPFKGQQKPKGFISTADELNKATYYRMKSGYEEFRDLASKDGADDYKAALKAQKDYMDMSRKRAKRADEVLKPKDENKGWKDTETKLEEATANRQGAIWDEYYESKSIVDENEFYEQAEQQQVSDLFTNEFSKTIVEKKIEERDERQADYQSKRQPAVKLNEALQYASSIYGGNSEYTKYLIPLMRQLMGDDYLPEAGDKTTYFTISKDYTGNPNELFRYVHFKTIPRGTEYVEKILELDWSSPENYYSHLADINAQRYSSNLTDSGFTPEVINLLEHIMNTSAAWRIAKRNAQDSDQVKSNWLTLFSTAQEAQGAGSNVMNKFVQMVMNEEDLGIIMQTIDTMIYSAVKE